MWKPGGLQAILPGLVGAISYRLDGREELMLDLPRISSGILLAKGTDAFCSRLYEWKHSNDDRDFPGDYAPVVPD